MALKIMTNVMSLNSQRHLDNSTARLNKSFEQLSSGKRINHSRDDAAGLAISDTLRGSIRSLEQGVRNAQDGISLIQIYEGGTNEIANSLIRMRELSMQAATDTVGDGERAMINNEFQELISEVDRLANVTEFNGISLLNGEQVELQFHVGNRNRDDIDRINYDPGEADLTAGGLDIDGLSVEDADSARDVLDSIDEALFKVNETRARVGAAQSRLETAVNSQKIFIENQEAAKSRLLDADMAEVTSNLTKDQIIQQAGASVLAQANMAPNIALKLLG